MDLGLHGRTAVVCASTSGLGLAIARALDAEGANVVVSGRRGDLARAEAGRLRHGVGVQVDLTEPGGPERLLRAATDAFGGVDIVVLNGGGPPPSGAADLDPAALRAGVELLLYPQHELVRLALPAMRARGWGRILAVGSSGVEQPIPDLAISNTGRAALAGLLKTLAAEVAADGVTVNMLLPGRIATERVAALDRGRAERTHRDLAEVEAASRAAIPAGRYGEPDEFGAVAAFLCSDRASYVTGTRLRVDGGLVTAH